MRIGFIGCGNMAKAMISGILKNQLTEKENITASDISEGSRKVSQEQLGINITASNLEVVANSDVLFLSVKPQYYETVINEIKDAVGADQIVVTIAPGKTLAWLSEQFEKDVKIVRCMPNTPALVGEGMTAATPNAFVTKEELETVVSILNSFGKTEVIGEYLMDAVVSVSGSSPAYVYMMIEAMADGAVADGMPRDMAYKFAAQAVMVSAKMVLESGKHPGELKDMVCSPAGTTIEAVRTLEKEGFRSSVMEAMKVCTAKAKGM
mgnify:CR=1 FL=1